jgi:hypothetical protein
MPAPSRRIGGAVIVVATAVVLTGCGQIVSTTFTNVGETVDRPAASAEPPAGDPTLALTAGMADGPGVSVTDAIAQADMEAALVNGIVLKDAGGTIWLCEELVNASPPSCDLPRLRVLNYPAGTADWDIETGAAIGLKEDAGVLWREGVQLYGVVGAPSE